MIAPKLIRYKATLRTVDRWGRERVEHHTAWDLQRALTVAYRRARSCLRAGQAEAFTIAHTEECLIR